MAAALLASGCSRVKVDQGYLADETLVTSIQAGIDNRQSVEKTLGRPTFASQFGEAQWYYVSRNTGQYAFIRPKVLSQSILIVSFDKDGNVTNVERRGMDKIANISPSGDKTPTLGRETGLFEDIFGNIGTVGAGGVGGTGPGPGSGPR
ncbi:outer membrane protein assembly factor BamE [Polymorphobacter sp.]|uniref:outer membrane protein assembly factor BamE n=1 Tax=Polymorphobacter sp. TaxID=1909290 RepID=UPI003F71687D